MKNKKNFKTDFRWSPDLPGSSVFFMEANKTNNMEKKTFNPDAYLWDHDQKIEHITELYRHLEDLYDEADIMDQKIEKLVQVNQELVTEILGLKAKLYDLLR